MSFKWSECENPYGCDDCGDIYNKVDLINYDNEHICRNCIDEYHWKMTIKHESN